MLSMCTLIAPLALHLLHVRFTCSRCTLLAPCIQVGGGMEASPEWKIFSKFLKHFKFLSFICIPSVAMEPYHWEINLLIVFSSCSLRSLISNLLLQTLLRIFAMSEWVWAGGKPEIRAKLIYSSRAVDTTSDSYKSQYIPQKDVYTLKSYIIMSKFDISQDFSSSYANQIQGISNAKKVTSRGFQDFQGPLLV